MELEDLLAAAAAAAVADTADAKQAWCDRLVNAAHALGKVAPAQLPALIDCEEAFEQLEELNVEEASRETLRKALMPS